MIINQYNSYCCSDSFVCLIMNGVCVCVCSAHVDGNTFLPSLHTSAVRESNQFCFRWRQTDKYMKIINKSLSNIGNVAKTPLTSHTI